MTAAAIFVLRRRDGTPPGTFRAPGHPVTTLASSLRNLWGNPNPQIADNFPSQNPILVTIGWIIVFIVVFGPLGVRRYRNMSR